ncbi:MAG: Hsp33 family molecular chaperone HslO [Myxococcota bacterium]|nr:Hsp33 family molecular chaperone HslO [Myxococcota bacterium]
MTDVFKTASIPDHGLSIGVAITTDTCREAARVHELQATSAIALGRLLTCTAIAGLMQEKAGALSMQIISSGRFNQAYADVTAEGNLRGYIHATDLDLPLFSTEAPQGRRSIAPGFGPGHLSVIRNADVHDFVQSNTELTDREVDSDVAHYLQASDQNATILRADVLLDDNKQVFAAGGIIVQALPGGNLDALKEYGERLHNDALPALLQGHQNDLDALLQAFCPDATPAGPGTPLTWQCRCSDERVLGALNMMSPEDLAEMVNERKSVSLTCQFCNKIYTVSPEGLEKVFTDTIIQRGNQHN